MKQENLDNYIAEFQSLANKAGYTLDEEATLNVFQNGLPNPLVVNIIKFHHPVTWNEWTSAAHIQHQEYVLLEDIMNVTIQRIVARLSLSQSWVESSVCFKVSLSLGRELFSHVEPVTM